MEAVEAVSTCGPGAVVTRCFTMHVERCVYAVEDGQTLLDVARVYGTDWHTLLSLNSGVRRPEGGLYGGQLLNIGHLYSVVAGDSLTSISGRFGTTDTAIHSLNADLAPQASLNVGQVLCILPDSCTGHRGVMGAGGV